MFIRRCVQIHYMEFSRSARYTKNILTRKKNTFSKSGIENIDENTFIIRKITDRGLRRKFDIFTQKLLQKKYTHSVAAAVVIDSTSRSINSNKEHIAELATETSTSPISDPIPEPPLIPEISFEEVIQSTVNALGEPTFASLGLGGYTPAGWVQHCFEFVHVTLGVPWWEVILIGTFCIRICLFPLVVIAQRNAAKMNNHLPQMQAIQLKMTEARQTGNQLETARYSQELMIFMKEKQVNPLKNMIVPLAQMPVFVSFFMALRQMANVPVDSLRTGGLWWFTDLTVPDQFYIMPVITSLTLWATVELGTDSAKLSAQNMQTMKYVLRAMPIFILPFTVNFPGAMLVYWTASNFISLGQVGFLRIPTVRKYFQIDEQVYHKPETLPVKPKGFAEGVRDTWTNVKIARELEDRRKLDELQFRRAGKGPLVKTFKYDPSKQVDPTSGAAMSAKKI